MRLNKFIALHTGTSRRTADRLVAEGQVHVNNHQATAGQEVNDSDKVTVSGEIITGNVQLTTIILNKPRGYVVSRAGQGSRTVYDLLPPKFRHLKPVGRLDKDSSGLLLMTNDGSLAEQLSHPRYGKQKTYHVSLDKPLAPLHRQMISDHGIQLDDGPSRFEIERQTDSDDLRWTVRMSEGRNRQIRRTFAALGYEVKNLHRTAFGPYGLGSLKTGQCQEITEPKLQTLRP